MILGDITEAQAVVELSVDQRTLFEGLPSWSWIGVLEFIDRCTKSDNVDMGKINVTAQVSSLGNNKEFVYYALNVKQFNVYCKKQGGKGLHIKNGLFAKMLSYCTDYMRGQIEVYDKAYEIAKASTKQPGETEGTPRQSFPGNRMSEVDDEMVDMSENDSEMEPLNVNP